MYPFCQANTRPQTKVDNAAQRNQKSATGMMCLGMAGRSSSGMVGTVGVCTKLKYQSNPIHMTPLNTCSQRTKNSQNSVPNSIIGPLPLYLLCAAADRGHDEDHDDGDDETENDGACSSVEWISHDTPS